MKKIILLAAFGVAGLVSAKNAEETKPAEEADKKEIVKEVKADDPEGRMNCYEYAMYIPCKDELLQIHNVGVQVVELPHGTTLGTVFN
ncbi:hypothetical protein QFZ37_001671 [Chryseobacterium ginsenosidimutans]|uniref:hypothetical protein n=1 Tax=Chryseobacterium ginsenosidimutans TaxID=687846 RepID=UPI00278A3558|nr:hypothetical protein [Chryseobacterium ginsenosidimutans]MDQ0593302.1 hypothetical protein [Chryseobacterium ginsenosidimutans]